MLRTRLFRGKEYPLTVYNGQEIINLAIKFYTKDCDGVASDFTFPEYISSYLRVYNERSGRRLLNLALTQSGAFLVVNSSASDMTFEEEGEYWYEVGYMRGPYEQALRYGTFNVI